MRIKLIEPRQPADDTRKAVMVRVRKERYKLWARAAKKRGMPVSTWLAELADQGRRSASGPDGRTRAAALTRNVTVLVSIGCGGHCGRHGEAHRAGFGHWL